MNIQDRRRAAALVANEFSARRNALRKNWTDRDIELRVKQLLEKHKLAATVKKLEAARQQVESIEKSLSVACESIWPEHKEKKYRGSCECHRNYEEIVKDAAKAELQDDKGAIDALHKQERTLLAQIEVAANVDDIKKILKQASLV